MNVYTPRRASAKFLDGDCPRGVLAIFDNGGSAKRNGSFDRYTVFYTVVETVRRDTWIYYRGMSEHPTHPQGFGIMGELQAHQVAGYRHRVYRHSTRWTDLPYEVQQCVWRDCREMGTDEPMTVHVASDYECGRHHEETYLAGVPSRKVVADHDAMFAWLTDYVPSGDDHPCGRTENAIYTFTITEAPADRPDLANYTLEWG